MNNRTEQKLTDLSGMEKAVKDILKQAWIRGLRYGIEQSKDAERWCGMNSKAHLRPKDYDSNGDIIPMACKEEIGKNNDLRYYGNPMNWESPKGDTISREALINVILNDRKLDGANANWEVNRILVHIKNAPTIEPFERIGSICEENCGYRPQGEWKSEGGFVFCNQCGSSHGVHKTNFCSNCGAKMINCSTWNIPPEEKNNEI